MSGSQCIYCGAINERGPYKGTCPQCPPGQKLVQKFGIPAGPPPPTRPSIEDIVDQRENAAWLAEKAEINKERARVRRILESDELKKNIRLWFEQETRSHSTSHGRCYAAFMSGVGTFVWARHDSVLHVRHADGSGPQISRGADEPVESAALRLLLQHVTKYQAAIEQLYEWEPES